MIPKPKYKKYVKPPKKLSTLLKLALRDLGRVEAKPKKYEVNMSVWHISSSSISKCSVCFAGAVMACGFDMMVDEHTVPSEFTNEWCMAFRALDALREGKVKFASLCANTSSVSDCDITPYDVSPKKFKNDIGKLIKRLEKKGC